MKKVRFETANKKSTDDLFDEIPHDYSPLQSYTGDAKFCLRADDPVSENLPIASYLKQIFLFLPGTFLLFFISLGSALAITDFTRENVFSRLFLFIYSVGFLSIFMTWFGLGDLTKRKHFVIPASIIVSGGLIGLLVRLSAPFFWLAERVIDDFGYAVWLLPVGLIVPVLAKDWVDSKKK